MADNDKKPKKRADKPQDVPEVPPPESLADEPVRIDPPVRAGKPDPWMSFLLTTTGATKAALAETLKEPLILDEPAQRLEGEEHLDFAMYRQLLTPGTLERVDEMVGAAQDAEPDPDAQAGRYCLVESPGGEWAVVRLFKTLEGLAGRIAHLEGTDVVVCPFYGIPLRLTRGPQRYLSSPDGRSAMMVPMYANGPTQIVDADLVSTIAIQEDGFLGHPALAEGRFPAWDMPKPRDFGSFSKSRPVDDEDEDRADDDEDDDQDGAGHPKD